MRLHLAAAKQSSKERFHVRIVIQDWRAFGELSLAATHI
jgi:hypothetical protein